VGGLVLPTFCGALARPHHHPDTPSSFAYQNGQPKDHSHQLQGVVMLLVEEVHGLPVRGCVVVCVWLWSTCEKFDFESVDGEGGELMPPFYVPDFTPSNKNHAANHAQMRRLRKLRASFLCP
jgi:hypothetical protein